MVCVCAVVRVSVGMLSDNRCLTPVSTCRTDFRLPVSCQTYHPALNGAADMRCVQKTEFYGRSAQVGFAFS
jgi:hypothetical protein